MIRKNVANNFVKVPTQILGICLFFRKKNCLIFFCFWWKRQIFSISNFLSDRMVFKSFDVYARIKSLNCDFEYLTVIVGLEKKLINTYENSFFRNISYFDCFCTLLVWKALQKLLSLRRKLLKLQIFLWKGQPKL